MLFTSKIKWVHLEIINILFLLKKYYKYSFSRKYTDAPICLASHDELLGALKHETLTLKCEVDASPPAESFHWTFNSSGEQTDLPSRLHSSEVSEYFMCPHIHIFFSVYAYFCKISSIFFFFFVTNSIIK